MVRDCPEYPCGQDPSCIWYVRVKRNCLSFDCQLKPTPPPPTPPPGPSPLPPHHLAIISVIGAVAVMAFVGVACLLICWCCWGRRRFNRGQDDDARERHPIYRSTTTRNPNIPDTRTADVAAMLDGWQGQGDGDLLELTRNRNRTVGRQGDLMMEMLTVHQEDSSSPAASLLLTEEEESSV